MIVRHERASDREAVHALVKAAFGRRDEADLVDRLREAGSVVLSLVALASGFSSPYAGPHLMVLALTGVLPVSVGAISYARPFAALD